MRNATINHRTACSHAQTPAARKECRKATRAAEAAKALVELHAVTTAPVAKLGKSDVTHLLSLGAMAAECGAGKGRGVRRSSPVYRVADGTEITCTKCAKMV